MLFPYTHVSHAIEKMQTFIDFIFYDVWCQAPSGGAFRLGLFDCNDDLKELMETFYYGDTQGGDYFYGYVESIYDVFSGLTVQQIDQLRVWYQANNDVEKVCANDPAAPIARYTDLSALHPDLSNKLASFFKQIYSHKFLGLAAVEAKIGTMDDHYRTFMSVNKNDKCPFCGITDMLGVYHTHREAYDHYLPKSIYPFNSINFKNLAPACHYCNSSYKTSKDPAFVPKDPAGATRRRKAFYPYDAEGYTLEVTVNMATPDMDRLEPSDIQLEFGPPELSEQITTWLDVYGIEERYKAKCCSGDAKDWLEQVRMLCDQGSLSPGQYLRAIEKQTEKDRFANMNFLKLAFLEGCDRAGILGALTAG